MIKHLKHQISLSNIVDKTICFAIVCFCSAFAHAEVRLPRQFQDKMVLQRGQAINIWGNASPNETVEVTLADEKSSTQADIDGSWQLSLPAAEASGSLTLTVRGAQNELVLKDVFIGDVWLLSGQSNAFVDFNYFFEKKIEKQYLDRFKNDLGQCGKESLVRNYLVACKTNKREFIRGETENRWFDCNAKDVSTVSPIAYYFARELSRKTQVMTAVVRIAWGGNRIENFYKGANNYNNMVKPWGKHKFKGVIWYQGESNVIAGDGLGYALKLQSLIKDYRELFNTPKLPFLLVQLPPAIYSNRPFLNENSLPVFLESQRQVLRVPHTWMAVASDLGMANGLHQPQKYELAIRLANLAFAHIYKMDASIPAGPQFQSSKIKDGRVIITFQTFGSKLTTVDGQPPKHFGIRKKGALTFEPAQAKIEGNTVVLWNDKVKKPYDVFLGFKETDLMGINLANTESVPAAVFWLRAAGQIHPGL